MPNIDGGHYFLTTLIPVNVDPQVGADGSFTSPSHVLREALATLPTAQQSPACVAAGFNSPFARCTRTHFVRAALITQPMFNGRDGGNALLQGFRNINLLAHQPVDRLSRPYLMFNADFDARADEADGGLTSWASGLWTRTEPELRAVFASCFGFDQVTDGAGFATWLKRCQIETTMSFNDYYVPTVDLHGYTIHDLVMRFAACAVVLSALAIAHVFATALSAWWLLALVPVALIASVLAVLRLLWVRGSQPFPTGAHTDLPSVLKALHVQQRFALFAADVQGEDVAILHARFGGFLAEVRPDDVAAPTQPPGVIRSDGTPLVAHPPIAQKPVAP